MPRFSIRTLFATTTALAVMFWSILPPASHLTYGELLPGEFPGTYITSVTNNGPLPVWLKFTTTHKNRPQFQTCWSYPWADEWEYSDYPSCQWERVDFLETVNITEKQMDYSGTKVGLIVHDMLGRTQNVWNPSLIDGAIARSRSTDGS